MRTLVTERQGEEAPGVQSEDTLNIKITTVIFSNPLEKTTRFMVT